MMVDRASTDTPGQYPFCKRLINHLFSFASEVMRGTQQRNAAVLHEVERLKLRTSAPFSISGFASLQCV